MNQIELIHWALIRESQLNPRKSFDEDSLKELAESISKQGLLQPITVRPMPEFKVLMPKELKGKPGYEIVLGARRYRASKMVTDLVEIPCIVREMTDEEAFDAMITENLQRKDVAPMDEARAFTELHKRGTSFEELAARFGKSVPFIRLRIKLNDLIPELVELLDKKELQISHAQELCKLNVDFQKELFENKYSENAESYYKWNEKPLKDIKNYIENDFRKLDNAIFDKSDCENCELRCGANALFSEYSENKCTSPDCYDEKTKQHYFSLIDEKVSNGYLLVKQNNLHTSMQEICKELEESGHSITERNYENSTWENIVEIPERDEDDTDEEWVEAMQEYNDDLAEQNERLENGYQKAFQIDYNGVKEILVKFNEKSILNSGENISEQSIKSLQGKDKRNAEIKVEKIYEDERKLIQESDFETYENTITDLERSLMYAAMIENTDWNFKREIEKKFDKDKSYLDNCKDLLGTPSSFKIIRAFIKKYVTAANTGLKDQLSAICSEVYPDEATRIELKHEDTYLKRKEKIDEQIKALTNQ